MSVPRGPQGVQYPDRVMGTVGELEKLRQDPRRYLTCGNPAPGMSRCPFAETCDHAWKGKEGTQLVVAIDDQLQIKRGEKSAEYPDGRPIMEPRAAGGPKNMAVLRRDAWTGKMKLHILSCVALFQHRKQWDSVPRDVITGQAVEAGRTRYRIQAIEGDGQLVPMPESKDKIVGMRKDGRPQIKSRTEDVYRAVPFYERPAEMMPDAVRQIVLDDLYRKQATAEDKAFEEAIPDDMRPLPLGVDVDKLRQQIHQEQHAGTESP